MFLEARKFAAFGPLARTYLLGKSVPTKMIEFLEGGGGHSQSKKIVADFGIVNEDFS